MQMDAGLDTGDILACLPVAIGENETAGELFDKVTQAGAAFLCTTLDDIAASKVQRTPQDNAKATLAPPLTKEMALLDFTRDAKTLHNLIRGLNPWPVAYFVCGEKKIKVLRSIYLPEKSGRPGEVLSTKPLTVACAGGALTLTQVVPEGSRPMEGTAWAAGKRLQIGDLL